MPDGFIFDVQNQKPAKTKRSKTNNDIDSLYTFINSIDKDYL